MARFAINQIHPSDGVVVITSNNDSTTTYLRLGDDIRYVPLQAGQAPFIETEPGSACVIVGACLRIR